MCFSASASFFAAGGLGVMGAVAQARVKRPEERLFASFPLLFATQQCAEGLVWLSMDGRAPPWLHAPATLAFLLFAVGLWPLLCALSVLKLEQEEGRRRILRALAWAGGLLGLYLFGADAAHGVHVEQYCGNLLYDTSFVPLRIPARIVYVAIAGGSFFVSSRRDVKLFGASCLVFVAITLALYREAFISVWCFFCAVLSASIFWMLSPAPSAQVDLAP